ncbi:hypothetical protein D3C72_933980 [compost metagenome]
MAVSGELITFCPSQNIALFTLFWDAGSQAGTLHVHTPLSGLTGYRRIPTGIGICGCEPVPCC